MAWMMEGPDIELGPQATTVLALVFHELATNAAKHGALSSSQGKLEVRWRSQDDRTTITWAETNGPPIVACPTHQGFGTLLAERSLGALGGRISLGWPEQGLSAQIEIPSASLVR